MPFPFPRRSRTEYEVVETNDYSGLEIDGVDTMAPSPQQDPRSIRPTRVDSRLSDHEQPAMQSAQTKQRGLELFLPRTHENTPTEFVNPGHPAGEGTSTDGVLQPDGHGKGLNSEMDIDTELRKMREEQTRTESRRSSIQQSRPSSKRYSGQLRSGEIASPSTYLVGSGNPFNDAPLQSIDRSTDTGTIMPDPPLLRETHTTTARPSSIQATPQMSSLMAVFEEADPDGVEERAGRQSIQDYGVKLPHEVFSPESQWTTDDDYEESIYSPIIQPPPEQRAVHVVETGQHTNESHAVPKRRGSGGSTNTFQQAATLFYDFDGSHEQHHADENEQSALMGDSPYRDREPDTGQVSRRHSIMTATQVPAEEFEPDLPNDLDAPSLQGPELHLPEAPEEKRSTTMMFGPVRPQTPPQGHVFYPAPIPVNLHLPPKLSRGRTAADLQRRKGEIIMAANARRGVLAPGMYESSSLKGVPAAELDPRVKASLYFDHAPVKHVLKPIEGSATRTLDHILNISANAPLGAFTDHPFAGKLGPEVYGPELTEKQRKAQAAKLAARKRSLQRPLDAPYYGPPGEEASPADPDVDLLELHDDVEEDEDDALAHEANDFQHEVPGYIPVDTAKPTTLLAELQLRKEEQKQRNRTAATAFPNGMHSTLLQLDAVAQHQAKSRRGRQVRLAWEDPEALLQDEDDEVPLGMLLPGAKRPEGSLLPPVPQMRELTPSPTNMEEEEEEEEEEVEETMGQRKARLAREAEEKKRYTINVEGIAKDDDAEEDDVPLAVRKARLHRRNSSAFTSEIMSQLGGLDDEKEDQDKQASPAKAKKIPARHRANRSQLSVQLSNDGKKTPEVEETLGQRRRRLQAEQSTRETAKVLQGEVRRRQNSIDMLNRSGTDARPSTEEQANNLSTPQLGNLLGMPGSSASLVMGPGGILQYTSNPEQVMQQQQQWQQQQQLQQQQQQQQQQMMMMMAAQAQPQAQLRHSYMPPQNAFVHPAYAARAGVAHQQQFATSLAKPGHLSAYQQQQLMSGFANPAAMTNRMSQLQPAMNTGRRDMVDRWRQGVPG